MDQQRADFLAKLAAFDRDLLDEPSQLSLGGRIERMSERELRIAAPILDDAFAEPDTATGATMLFLLDKRFGDHLEILGSTCATLLDLVVGEQMQDAQSQSLVDDLVRADGPRHAQIVAGLPVANRSLRHAHHAFRFAWGEAPREAQHREPIHRGEPTPYLRLRGFVELCLFVAKRIEPYVPASEKPVVAAAIDVAQRSLDGEKVKAPPRYTREPLRSLEDACVQYAVQHSREPSGDATMYRGGGASGSAVTILRQAPDSVAIIARFLRDLDDELRRLDAIAALGAKKKAPSSPIASAVFRAPNLWVVRLEGGEYGLLQKQARKLTWVEGSRDDVLSSVPDELFERAALAAKDEG